MVERSLSHASGKDINSIDAAALARMSMSALDELFAELEPAALEQIQGRTRGRLVALRGFDWLPGFARGLAMSIVNRLPLWGGESFEGEFGTNTWLLPANVEFARCVVRRAPSLEEGEGETLRLDYDVAANPKLLREVVSELRELRPGLFLVRTRYRIGQHAPKLSYYLLER